MKFPMFLVLLVSLVVTPIYAQVEITNRFEVKVKKAQAVVTSTTVTSVQVVSEDGASIGKPNEKEGEPVVSNGQDVGVVLVEVGRPWEEVAVKVRSTTANFINLLPGVYATKDPGTHQVNVSVLSVVPPVLWDDALVTVIVGGEVPGPSPGPTPQPQPPSPNGPPIDGPGLRVLFVYETAESLPRELEEVFYGNQVRSFINSVVVKVDEQPEFRLVDQDAQFTDPNHRFAKALVRPRSSIPWLIISNGTTGYEGPFPGGVSATLELVRSFVPLQATVTTSVPKIVMYSAEGCIPCATFKRVELPKLVGIDFSSKPPVSSVSLVPTFDIYVGAKSRRLVGYQTAANLLSIIEGMK